MVVTNASDPNAAMALFTNEGVEELLPEPAFDYRSYTLEEGEAHRLIGSLTRCMVDIEDKTGRFKYQLEDGRVIDTTSFKRWEWAQAIGLNGLFDYYKVVTSNGPCAAGDYTLDVLKQWYHDRNQEGIPTKNINSMAVLYSVACLVELDQQRGNTVLDAEWRSRFLEWMDEWAEYIMNQLPRTQHGGFQHLTFRLPNVDQIWDDTLMMTVIPLTKIGLYFNRPHYIEEAKYQFLIHIQYLMDHTSGLWYHGWEFNDKGNGHNFAKALWGRGNCWVTLAIPMFIELTQLSSSNPIYRTLVSTLIRQINALLQLQDPSTGLWHTLLDDSSTYVETSGSAGFVGGMLMAIRLGLIDREKYLAPALKGLNACIAQVTPNGEVGNVSKGTPVGRTLDFYQHIPRTSMVYGNSLLIVAIVQWLQLDK